VATVQIQLEDFRLIQEHLFTYIRFTIINNTCKTLLQTEHKIPLRIRNSNNSWLRAVRSNERVGSGLTGTALSKLTRSRSS